MSIDPHERTDELVEGADEEEMRPSTRRSESGRKRRGKAQNKGLRWTDASPKSKAQRAEFQRPGRRLRREIGGIAFIVAGLVILFASNAPSSGVLPTFLKWILGALVGELGSSIVALGLMALGIGLVVGHSAFRVNRMIIGLGILFVAFLALRQMAIPMDGIFGRRLAYEPGGLIGLLLAEALKPLFGRVWGSVILVAGCLCAIAQMSEAPLAVVFRRIVGFFIRGMVAVWNWLAARLHHYSHRQRLEKIAARNTPQQREVRAPSVQEPLPFPSRRRQQSAEEPKPERTTVRALPKPTVEEKTKEEIEEAAKEPESETLEESSYDIENYTLPPQSLLTRAVSQESEDEHHEDTINKMELLEQTLSSFGIKAKVVEVERGPRVTRYEIRSPRGIRVSRITNLADDLAYSLSALDVRVEAPVPGKGVIGIEVPNSEAVFVDLVEILASKTAQDSTSPLTFALGKDITGNPRVADLAKMPHMLIAGATNSGKSVCLNAIIASLLFRTRPDEAKLLLIDPKRVELSLFSKIPHLVAPVAHDVKEAAGLLRWALREMERRYELFADLGVRNITGYNERAEIDEELDKLWYLVIIIDELADLMMQAKGEFEASICRLAQLARATGIHLVVATQRPSVNVITGTIKANISSRIAFAVASQADSRVILDMNGAERLVGSGDMLYLPIDEAKPARIQGAYISEKDIGKVTKFLREQAKPEYSAEAVAAEKSGSLPGAEASVEDELFDKALEYVLSTKYASASMLQRRMRVGYTRAARLIDMMEERGYIGPADGSKPREVFVDPAMMSNQSPAE